MTGAAKPVELERFRALISARLGLQLEDARQIALAEILERSAAEEGRGCERFLQQLEAGSREPWAALAQELTVPESHFFRYPLQFRALAERVLPERAQRAGAEQPLRILSAACASGEEPYSIAIAARESLDPPRAVSILAVDVNRAVLARAARGRFSRWSLRETPAAAEQRWFRPHGAELEVDPELRAAVRFEERNLIEDDAELWPAAFYDVVFFRNALMYFTAGAGRAVLARIARSLAPGGYLFLGHAENLRGISDAFELCHTHGTFYYQRRESAAARSRDPAPPPLAPACGELPWMRAIGDGARKVRALAEHAFARSLGAAGSAQPAPRPELQRALELLREERFAEALQQIHELPRTAAEAPAALLLEALLLVQSGALERAEPVCRRLLELDELHSGAHYVLALCRAASADARGAADHDQIAADLDPGFAMPRLHLGLLARREGKRETAQRELERALPLLEREEAERLLLFGGGFSREALIALCRSELRACGERP